VMTGDRDQGPPVERPAQGPGADAPVDPAQSALIARAITGDHASLDALWKLHRRWVAAVLIAHGPRQVDTDDLLQEVAVLMVGKISTLRDTGAFKPWLRTIALSVARTSGRRTSVRKAGFLKVAREAGADEDARLRRHDPHQTDAVEQGRSILDASLDLPDGYREPLILKCVHGMSYREIGRVMDLPETTIETRIARARKMLRERVLSDPRHARVVALARTGGESKASHA
jgi:RNA polymerase sigma-70 factor, ECF subfamily